MKTKLKLTSLHEKGVEKLEVEKLQNIKGGCPPGICKAPGQGSCNTTESFHDKFSDW
ncbi:MAG: hypothetical protein HXX16_16945 [Bacteroidales bacterium]|nr:hypothetical protein [Bacteroidales bacterium]